MLKGRPGSQSLFFQILRQKSIQWLSDPLVFPTGLSPPQLCTADFQNDGQGYCPQGAHPVVRWKDYHGKNTQEKPCEGPWGLKGERYSGLLRQVKYLTWVLKAGRWRLTGRGGPDGEGTPAGERAQAGETLWVGGLHGETRFHLAGVGPWVKNWDKVRMTFLGKHIDYILKYITFWLSLIKYIKIHFTCYFFTVSTRQ